MIKVLIVEDSPIVSKVLSLTLQSDPEIKVMGIATNGLDALSFIESEKPDVITMDLYMPKMDGVTATQEIMSTNAVPIIVVTAGDSDEENMNSFKALQAGAVAIALKPKNKDQAQKLIETVKQMAEVNVITQNHKISKHKQLHSLEKSHSLQNIKIIAMGVSTGGPSVLQKILGHLKHDNFPPIVIVQHISNGFIQYMADWLHETTKIPVKIAENGMKLEEGIVYLAPDVCDIGISKNLMVELNHQSNADNGVHPSVGYLFHSIAQNFKNQAMGILLTGMGQDGAKELKVLKDKGAITISQDEASSIVYGMPKAAKELDAALYTLSPKEIALMINRIKDEN